MVTGATGFVGLHTARALIRAGHEVRLLIRDPVKFERLYRVKDRPLPEHVVGDMTDPECVAEAMAGCDGVVHAAAQVALEAVSKDALQKNALGVETVLGQAQRLRIGRVVYVSTMSALFEPGGPPVTADSPVTSQSGGYMASKAEGERLARGLQDAGAPISITYPSAVIGPDDPGLSEANRGVLAMARDLFVITTGGFQAIDVRDLAQIHVRLLERGAGAGRYLATGHYLSWPELGRLLQDLTNGKLRTLKVTGALLRFSGRVGDVLRFLFPIQFPLTHEGMVFASLWQPVDCRPTLEELDLTLRDADETYADTLRWLASAGHLHPAKVAVLMAAETKGPSHYRAR
jgi:nucleoside-diphosphate-sugar epimerase